jgi:uncharacterized protein involved in exopolysaccharide biosynthesis
MLDTYAATQDQVFYDERPGQAGLAHYLDIAKRRLLYFIIPFILVFGAGALVIAIQRPIYLAEGRILVESQDIPADLVRPTVMDTANQRIQVIQQRIMTRDNLLALINKFGLFTSQQKWMAASQLLDLMRERTKLELVDLSHPAQQNNLTIALKLSFEYENPQLAMRVANEFLTLILAADARTRITRATETTKFLARDVARIEGDLGAVDAQIALARQRPLTLAKSDELGTELTKLKADLLQKSSLYSNAHPEVRALKRRIAALEQAIAKKPPEPDKPVETGLDELLKQRTSVEKNLDEANRKLAAARLGESLERDQQSERLQVIEQPTVPQKPVKPNRPKLFAMAFILAGMVGMGTVIAAESLDRTIRNTQQLFGVVDSHMIVAIPYISTQAEMARRKRKIVLALLFPFVLIGGGVGALLYLGLPTDLSLWFEGTWTDTARAWFDTLTRLSK